MNEENKEYSFAREILQDYKVQNERLFILNKRLFVVIGILLTIIFLFVGGLVYVVTNYDFAYEDTTIDGDNNNYNSEITGDVINGD